MSVINKLYADFNNNDAQGRIRLIVKGTLDDLNNKNSTLKVGDKIVIYEDSDKDDVLEAIAEVQFSENENIWVAKIEYWIE